MYRRLLAVFAAFAAAIAAPSAAAEKVEVSYGETYVQRDSGPLKADVYVPHGAGPFPGVLVIHGGAWRMGTRAQLAGVAKMLAERGFTAVAISYRLAPAYKFPAQIDDCKSAVRWMRTEAARWKIDSEHIGAFGYSAAQLAALLGTTDADDGLEGVPDPSRLPTTRLQVVVAGGAPCDFRPIPPDVEGLAFWLGDTPGVPEQYRLASPAAFVTADDPPMFFFHGENDELVPRISPVKMVAALTAAGVPNELYMVPKCGHIMACMSWPAIERSAAFLEKHLKPQTQP